MVKNSKKKIQQKKLPVSHKLLAIKMVNEEFSKLLEKSANKSMENDEQFFEEDYLQFNDDMELDYQRLKFIEKNSLIDVDHERFEINKSILEPIKLKCIKSDIDKNTCNNAIVELQKTVNDTRLELNDKLDKDDNIFKLREVVRDKLEVWGEGEVTEDKILEYFNRENGTNRTALNYDEYENIFLELESEVADETWNYYSNDILDEVKDESYYKYREALNDIRSNILSRFGQEDNENIHFSDIKDYIHNRTVSFDDKGITSITPSKKFDENDVKWAVELDVSNNMITSIEKIPDSIISLKIENNPIRRIGNVDESVFSMAKSIRKIPDDDLDSINISPILANELKTCKTSPDEEKCLDAIIMVSDERKNIIREFFNNPMQERWKNTKIVAHCDDIPLLTAKFSSLGKKGNEKDLIAFDKDIKRKLGVLINDITNNCKIRSKKDKEKKYDILL